MEQNTDTDYQENESYTITSKTCQPERNVMNFDAMAENLMPSEPGAYETLIQNVEPVQQETIQIVQQEATVQIISSENSDTMLSNQTLILNKLNSIIDNQTRFAHKLASLSVQLEEAKDIIRHLQQEKQCNVTLLQDASPEEQESFSLKPIESNEEFEMFETNLADRMQRKKFIKFLSTLYSSKPGQGQTCAYKLIDILFTKEFLCHCSWSGGSKGEHSKIPMKNFTNFRIFFFEIIHMWDPSFTGEQMLNFFKIVLRNANKRKSMQGIRASTKRTRKSRNNEVKVGTEEKENNDEDSDRDDQLEANKENSTNGGDNNQLEANEGNDMEQPKTSGDSNELKANKSDCVEKPKPNE